MKKTLLIFLFLSLSAPALAESVSTWSPQTGFRNYDVQRSGDSITVYDYKNHTYTNGTTNGDNTSFYNTKTNSFYDLNQTAPGKYTGYDYKSNTFQDYDVDDNGNVNVFDYGNGEYLNDEDNEDE